MLLPKELQSRALQVTELIPPIPPEDKLTPEFPGDVLPVRDGVYLRHPTQHMGWRFARFEQGLWYVFTNDKRQAELTQNVSYNQTEYDWKWKGLNYDPQQS